MNKTIAILAAVAAIGIAGTANAQSAGPATEYDFVPQTHDAGLLLPAVNVAREAPRSGRGYPGGLPARDGVVGSDMEPRAATGPGGGPHIRVFDGATVPAADGTPDIITGTGPGGGPHVRSGDDVIVDGRIITAENFGTAAGSSRARR